MSPCRLRIPRPMSRSRTLGRLLGILGLVVSLGPAPGSAQAAPKSPLFTTGERGAVLSGGLGRGNHGGAGLLALGVPAGPGEVVVRVGGSWSATDGLADLGVLYGMRIVGEQGWVRLAGGGAALAGASPGLAGQVDLVLKATERFGLGLGLHGALGGEGYAGFSLGLYLGWPGYWSS